MANDTDNNPLVIDTAATITGRYMIQLIQWIDNAADIADDDDLVFSINGQTITGKIQLTDNTANNLVVFEAGPFNPPIMTNSLVVTTIDHGILVVWLA